MNIKEFEKYLDTYGADFSRWPKLSAREAQNLTERDNRAAALYVQAQKLDEALSHYTVPEPDPGLSSRVSRRLEQDTAGGKDRSKQAVAPSWTERLFPAATGGGFATGGLALAAVAGILLLTFSGMPEPGALTGTTPPGTVDLAENDVPTPDIDTLMTDILNEEAQLAQENQALQSFFETADSRSARDVDVFVEDIAAEETRLEQENAALLSFFEAPENSAEPEIEEFLDDLYGEDAPADSPQDSPEDIWEQFYNPS